MPGSSKGKRSSEKGGGKIRGEVNDALAALKKVMRSAVRAIDAEKTAHSIRASTTAVTPEMVTRSLQHTDRALLRNESAVGRDLHRHALPLGFRLASQGVENYRNGARGDLAAATKQNKKKV